MVPGRQTVNLRRATAIAAGAGTVNLFLVLTALWLALGEEKIPVLVVGTWVLVLTGLGGLVATRQSRNPIGWLMQGSGFFVALLLWAEAYGSYGVVHGALPGYAYIAALALWAGLPGFGLLIFLFLTFPTGTYLSPAWRWLGRAAAAAIVLGIAALAIRPGPIPNVTQLDNPFGIASLRELSRRAETLGGDILGFVALASIVSLFLRFRRSRGVERQQMKWFVFAVAVFPAVFGISALAAMVDKSEEDYLTFLIVMAGLLFVPVAMGVGILRYRLYEIDVIVNRTLVYGVLTAILAASYFGLVVLLRGLLEPATKDSDIAVAASTLAVAGLFQPVRARVQRFIDRRFYRNKYDTAATLRDFSTRLRDQVDLDALGRDLVAVVGTTMQPSHASLWLRREVGE
jgi:hypothetical protein